MEKELPKGWVETDLQEVAEVLDKYRKPINSSERDGRVAGKAQNELYPYFGATGQVGYIDDYLLDGEFVLLGEDGAPFLEPFKSKAYLVNGKVWVNNHAHILKSRTSNKFLCYYLNQINYHDFVSGTTRLKLTQAAMNKIPIPLPPLPEQHRIVAKIEELFSELDNGVAQLQALLAQLKTYLQSVLKWAFEGKLTEGWRRQQLAPLGSAAELLEQIRTERQARYEADLTAWKAAKARGEQASKPSAPKDFPPLTEEELEGLPELPEGWMWVNIHCFMSEEKKGMTTGPFGTLLKKSDHKKGGIPVLGIENIGEGVFKMPNKIFVSPEKAIELSSFEVEKGDVIISRSGTVGEICAVTIDIGKAIISTNLIRVSLNIHAIDSKYFVYLFQGGQVREQVKELCAGSTRDFLNQTILNSIKFPFCSLEEQHQIVAAIETRLSACEEAEGAVRRALAQAEGLRQSILKRAFEGRLVGQE